MEVCLIFLDIDGVLNTIHSSELIEDEAVNYLVQIIKYTNAKIVLISSWDLFWIDPKLKFNKNANYMKSVFETKLSKVFKENNMDWNIKDMDFVRNIFDIEKNESNNSYEISLCDKPELEFEKSRQCLIERYINKNYNQGNLSYVVIDDFMDFYESDLHIQTNYYDRFGFLSAEDSLKAISILNKTRKKV